MTAFVIHAIAAILTLIGATFAVSAGSRHEKGDKDGSNIGIAIALILLIAAFVLQVIA